MKKLLCLLIITDKFINSHIIPDEIIRKNSVMLEQIKQSMESNNLLYEIFELENNPNKTKEEEELLKKLLKTYEKNSKLDINKENRRFFLNQKIQELENVAEKIKKIEDPTKEDEIALQITQEIIEEFKKEGLPSY